MYFRSRRKFLSEHKVQEVNYSTARAGLLTTTQFANMAFAMRIARLAFSTSASRFAIKHVTVIGCGLMGSGIA